VTGVQTCALPICRPEDSARERQAYTQQRFEELRRGD